MLPQCQGDDIKLLVNLWLPHCPTRLRRELKFQKQVIDISA
jgi:hypothetical protein